MKVYILAAAALIAAMPAQAITYDAFADFSIAANPNGPWRYGHGVPGVNFTALIDSTPAWLFDDVPTWWDLAGGHSLPIVAANQTGAVQAFGTFTIPSDALLLHPSSDGRAVIVQFVAPESGDYDFALHFAKLDTGSVAVSANLDGTDFLAPLLLPNDGYADAGVLTLAAGDVLSFAVDSAGSIFNDSTAFNVTLALRSESIPEPSTIALMLVGFGALASIRRSRG